MLNEPTTASRYKEQRLQDLKLAKELYKKYGTIKYYNGWVMIGGIAINGISRGDKIEDICEKTERANSDIRKQDNA